MGIKKKHVPGNSCCGESCVYAASDGNEYSDSFGGLDPGWQTSSGGSIYVSGGQLVVDGNSLGNFFAYRLITVTGTDFLIIMEVEFYSAGTTSTQVMYIGDHFTGAQPQGWGFHHAGGGWYEAIYGGGASGAVGPTPANGDKLSMSIQGLGDGNARCCYYVNEELVFSVTTGASASQFVDYGFITSITFNLNFDNFTIHNGNP